MPTSENPKRTWEISLSSPVENPLFALPAFRFHPKKEVPIEQDDEDGRQDIAYRVTRGRNIKI